MSNFDENDQTSIANFIVSNISRHEHFVLATTDAIGNPWAVCLNLTMDDKANIIWKSLITTEHSRHVTLQPKVAICVFSKSPEIGDFGFYARALAHEITTQEELEQCFEFRYIRHGKPKLPASDFLAPMPARLYYAELQEAWVNDDRHMKTEVDLEFLRNVLHVSQRRLS